jgi:Fe-Mn family superoxide dismutase
MPQYVLPDLRYDYGALQPHISGRIMELHHDKHHAAYVKGANDALEQLAEARRKNDFARIAALEKALAFNLSGHVLHSLFWLNLTPRAEEKPKGPLAQAIDRDFGSFDAFKKQMVEAATTIMGSGWAALAWEPVGRRLITMQVYDHQGNVTQGGIPLMVIDAWEHAYYLQYENRKADFFQAIWNTWNWKDVAERLEAASQTKIPLAGIAA